MIEHQRGAAVLERAARHLRFELEQRRRAIPIPLDQRRPTLAERYARRFPERQRGAVAPQRRVGALDLVARHSGSRRQVEVTAAAAAPEWTVGRQCVAAGGALIGGG